MGTNDLTKGGTLYKVAECTAHEHNDIPKLANDIAVVKLQEKIKFNIKIQPIELGRKDVPDNALVQLTGWGSLKVRRFKFVRLCLKCEIDFIGQW